jgi:hypothetical protein
MRRLRITETCALDSGPYTIFCEIDRDENKIVLRCPAMGRGYYGFTKKQAERFVKWMTEAGRELK